MPVSLSDQVDLTRDQLLRDKVLGAMRVAAVGVFEDGSPPVNQANRIAWAVRVVANPAVELDKMMPLVIAANAGAASKAAVSGASDAAIQNNVDAKVDALADNDAG